MGKTTKPILMQASKISLLCALLMPLSCATADRKAMVAVNEIVEANQRLTTAIMIVQDRKCLAAADECALANIPKSECGALTECRLQRDRFYEISNELHGACASASAIAIVGDKEKIKSYLEMAKQRLAEYYALGKAIGVLP
jgi:hypothetical protein